MKKLIAVLLVFFAYPICSANEGVLELKKTAGFEISVPAQSIVAPILMHPNYSKSQTHSNNNFLVPDAKDEMYVFAGNDSTVCMNTDSIEVSGYAENYHFVSWAHTGDGFFYNATKLNTAYVPGAGDISAGHVTLFLMAISAPPEYHRLVDSITYTIIPAPSCFAGYNATICDHENYQLQGQASNFSDLYWSTSGDGSFDFQDILNPVYFPGDSDLESGHVSLSITAMPNAPCDFSHSNEMHICIEKAPLVHAGADAILCAGNNLSLEASVYFYDEIVWLTSGDGTFSDMFDANSIYFPGVADHETGYVELTIVASPNLPCINNISDGLTLEVVSVPIVDVGSNKTLCDESLVHCNATAENFDHVQWFALGGNGTFDDATILTPVYTLGSLEKNTRLFHLHMCTYPVQPCQVMLQNNFEVRIQDSIPVFAGEDLVICQTGFANLSGDVGTSENFYWTTTGDGTFAATDELQTEYFPGNQDVEAGMVKVMLEASSALPCNYISMDTLEILVTRLPDAYAGENRIACADVSLTGTAENYSGVLWMSSGDGSFSSPNDLNTMYHMGPSDIENQNVVISLNVGSNAPCFTFSSDSIALNLDVPEILSSNLEDKTLMVGDQLMLDFEVASQMEGTYQWYFNDQPLTATLDGTLIFNNLQPAQAGSYYCIYSNGCEETLSDTAFVTLYEQYFQTINVKLGWNAISSYIYPSNSSMEAVLNPILDNLIILFNDNGLFYPDHELMTFSNWNVNTGYILKTNDEASFEISGITKYPRQPINVPPGWSLFPVNITCVVHVEDLFIAYPEIQSIKEIGGLELYWPQMGIMTLENIHPGKAYEIFNASDTEISITFPGCED